MPDWVSLVFLAGIVGFWAIMFFVALFLTRRSLRGIGELSSEELADLPEAAADGHTPPGATPLKAQPQGSGTASAGGH